MPLVRIHLPADTSPEETAAVSDAVHQAMVQHINVPLADRFQTIHRHAPGDLVCSSEFLGIAHGAKVVMVQITLAFGRPTKLKQALYGAIASGIAGRSGFAADDVIINLVEVLRENWSFGRGVAQYAVADAQAVLA